MYGVRMLQCGLLTVGSLYAYAQFDRPVPSARTEHEKPGVTICDMEKKKQAVSFYSRTAREVHNQSLHFSCEQLAHGIGPACHPQYTCPPPLRDLTFPNLAFSLTFHVHMNPRIAG